MSQCFPITLSGKSIPSWVTVRAGVRKEVGEFEQLPKGMKLPYLYPEQQTFDLINYNERMKIYPKITLDHKVHYLPSKEFSVVNS